MERLRTPFFWLALLALGLAILVEAGSGFLVRGSVVQGLISSKPGWGLRYLAFFDLVLLFGVSVIGLGLLAPKAAVGRLQGPVALVLAILGVLGGLALALAALTLLIVMVTLLVSAPFGTIAYLARWGRFPLADIQALLALATFLKLAFVALLLLAQQRFLANVGLVILTAASIALTVVVSFVIGFPPSFLSSIADVLSALLVAVIAAVWLLVLAIASLLNLLAVARSVPA